MSFWEINANFFAEKSAKKYHKIVIINNIDPRPNWLALCVNRRSWKSISAQVSLGAFSMFEFQVCTQTHTLPGAPLFKIRSGETLPNRSRVEVE
jgi:hypothetical protein